MARRPAFLTLALCVALLAPAGLAGQGAVTLAELPVASSLDLQALPSGMGAFEYRFAPDGPWIRFDSSIALSASPGEERSYTIETRSSPSSPAHARSVVIDKRRPPAPKVEPVSGLYREAITVKLSASENSRIRYALLGPGTATPAFVDYNPASPPRLVPPSAGSATRTLLVEAVDAAGNESGLVRREFRLAAPGLDYSSPPPDPAPPALVADPLESLGEPAVVKGPGRLELSFPLPSSGSLLAAVNPPAGSLDATVFTPLAVADGRAVLVLQCPRGWSGILPVHFALASENGVAYRATPFRAELSGVQVSPRPGQPSLAQGGGSAFLVFPPYDGRIYVSLASGPFISYTGPLALPTGVEGANVAWYGVASSGVASPESSLVLPRQAAVTPSTLEGVPSGGLANGAVRLLPAGKLVLRYEASRDGSAPREPDASSPRVGEALVLDAPPGEEASFQVRYRGFAGEDAAQPADEGGILAFTVDRKAPEAPRPVASLPAYTSTPLSLDLASEAAEVYALVEGGGMSGTAMRLSGPLVLPGSADGAIEYIVRAWAVDKAGNRSPDMSPVTVVVDVATLYVSSAPAGAAAPVASASPSDTAFDEAQAEEGESLVAASGDGSRERPFPSLDEALAIAGRADSGRRTVCVRGEVPFSGVFALENRSLSIKGGFDADWKPVEGGRATLVIAAATTGSAQRLPTFAVTGGRLSLSGLDLKVSRPGTLVSARSGSTLELSNVGLAVTSGGDFLGFDLDGSRLAVSASDFALSAAQSATFAQASSSELKVESSRITAAAGVRYYSAFTLSGGGLELGSTSLSSAASLATRLLSLEGASIQADRVFLDVTGGPGYLSVAGFSNVNGVLSNSRVRVSWKGVATLFRLSGGGPAFIHDSVAATTQKGRLRFFDSDGASPVLRNSIFACQADSSEFLVTASSLQPGLVTSCSLSGFTTLVSQAGVLLDLAGLNALNAKVKGAKPSLTEAFSKTWPSSPFAKEGSFALGPDSACVDAATPLTGFPRDYGGKARPQSGDKAKPDMGSDER